jgi:hypothetical protein
MMSEEGDTGVIICTNEGKDMKVKPIYKSTNLLCLLFQSPGKRKKKTRTNRVNDPNEDSKRPLTKIAINPNEDSKQPLTKMVSNPNEVVISVRNANHSVKNIFPNPMGLPNFCLSRIFHVFSTARFYQRKKKKEEIPANNNSPI